MKFLRSRLFAFIMCIVLLCVGLMLHSAYTGESSRLTRLLGTVVTPVQNAVAGAFDGVNGFFGYFYRYSSLVEENQRLQEELAEYREMEQKYLNAINENTELRKLTGLKAKYRDFDFELCQVASVYRGSAQAGMVLSKGSSAGIEQGDTVMTRGGMIGYVSDLGPGYCEVVTVLDVAFKAEAKVARTRETVIAEGDFELMGDGYFRLSYLSPDCDIQEGDIIETSGYAGVYPQGLILGTVKRVELDSSGLMAYAVVQPVEDISEVRWVYAVKDFEVAD